jgi:hypothetical protein
MAVANHSKNFLQVPALIGAMEKFFHKEHGKGIPCAVGANESTCRMSLKTYRGAAEHINSRPSIQWSRM